MSDPEPVAPGPTVLPPTARVHRTRWVGLVWAIPLAALIVVGFLGIRALANRGIDVVVTFESGAGARVGDTKVIYQGVEAGSVTKIEINQDGRRVDMTLRLDPRSEPALTSTAKFWLIGASPTLNDLASVKAAVAGVTIGVSPGRGGTPARHFDGLGEPPIVMPDTPGQAFELTSDVLGTSRVGTSLYFHGQEIGKITATRFQAPTAFFLSVFIFAPYDKLIQRDSLFWVASPVRVSLSDTGASASLEHAGALINGAIEVDHLASDATGMALGTNAHFPLYQSRSEAELGPVGPQVLYSFAFNGPGGDLNPGSPVRLLGFQIGEVKAVHLVVDERTGGVSTTAVAALYPRRLKVAAASSTASAPAGSAAEEALWRGPTDAAVTRLLSLGHRAQLVQRPPVIGSRIITLDRLAGVGPATLGPGESRLIPSASAGGGVEEMTGQVSSLLIKINAIPFDTIGRDLGMVTGRLGQFVASPKFAQSLQRLDSTLSQLEQMVGEVRPQVGPLIEKLNRAADEATETVAAARGVLSGTGATGAAADASLPAALEELAEASRSIRLLTDYLGRHPESLLRGRGADDRGADSTKDKK